MQKVKQLKKKSHLPSPCPVPLSKVEPLLSVSCITFHNILYANTNTRIVCTFNSIVVPPPKNSGIFIVRLFSCIIEKNEEEGFVQSHRVDALNSSCPDIDFWWAVLSSQKNTPYDFDMNISFIYFGFLLLE